MKKLLLLLLIATSISCKNQSNQEISLHEYNAYKQQELANLKIYYAMTYGEADRHKIRLTIREEFGSFNKNVLSDSLRTFLTQIRGY